MELTQLQKDMLPAIEWLFATGDTRVRATGRSTMIAWYLLHKAINTGYPVRIFDHHDEYYSRTHVRELIKQIARENYPNLDIHYNRANGTIEVRNAEVDASINVVRDA
jgi:hypothetical protein